MRWCLSSFRKNFGSISCHAFWEPGIVILPDVRETDCMTAICSWKAALWLVAFHSAPSLGWLHGEWLESLGGLTGSWQTPLPYLLVLQELFGPLWSNLWYCRHFPLSYFSSEVLCFSWQIKRPLPTAQTFFLPPRYFHALFLSLTYSHALTLMFFFIAFLCSPLLRRRKVQLRLCQDS